MSAPRSTLYHLIVWILLLSACAQTPARPQATLGTYPTPPPRAARPAPTTDRAGPAGDAPHQGSAVQSTQTPRPRQGPIAPGTAVRVGHFTVTVYGYARNQQTNPTNGTPGESFVLVDYAVRNDSDYQIQWSMRAMVGRARYRFALVDVHGQSLNEEPVRGLPAVPLLVGKQTTTDNCQAGVLARMPTVQRLNPGQVLRGWAVFQQTTGTAQDGVQVRVSLPMNQFDDAPYEEAVFQLSETLVDAPVAWEGLGKTLEDSVTVDGVTVHAVHVGSVDQHDPCRPGRSVAIDVENTTGTTIRLPLLWVLDQQGRAYQAFDYSPWDTLEPRQTKQLTRIYPALPGILATPPELLVLSDRPINPYQGKSFGEWGRVRIAP